MNNLLHALKPLKPDLMINGQLYPYVIIWKGK